MNLSKKTIKHILRILDNKCVKSPVETAVFSDGEIEFMPKHRTKYGIQYVVYAISDGYFYYIWYYVKTRIIFSLDFFDVVTTYFFSFVHNPV